MKLFMVDLNEAFLLFSSHLVSYRFGSVHFRWRQQRQRRISYKLTHIFSKPMLIFAAPIRNFLSRFVSPSNLTIFLFLTCIHIRIRTQFHLPFAQWLKLHCSTHSINRAANKLTLSKLFNTFAFALYMKALDFKCNEIIMMLNHRHFGRNQYILRASCFPQDIRCVFVYVLLLLCMCNGKLLLLHILKCWQFQQFWQYFAEWPILWCEAFESVWFTVVQNGIQWITNVSRTSRKIINTEFHRYCIHSYRLSKFSLSIPLSPVLWHLLCGMCIWCLKYHLKWQKLDAAQKHETNQQSTKKSIIVHNLFAAVAIFFLFLNWFLKLCTGFKSITLLHHIRCQLLALNYIKSNQTKTKQNKNIASIWKFL